MARRSLSGTRIAPTRPPPIHCCGGIVGAVYLADVMTTPNPDWELGWWDGESLAWMISGCKQVDAFTPMKGRLQPFDVELP